MGLLMRRRHHPSQASRGVHTGGGVRRSSCSTCAQAQAASTRFHGTRARFLDLMVLAGVLCAAAAGCSGLRLDYPPRYRDGDIVTFAGNTLRNNDAALPDPPLTLDWEQDVTAGFGEGGPLVVDSFLFIGNLRGELYAFNAYTGRRYGWVTLGGAIHGSPVIEGTTVFVPLVSSRETLVAYDFMEGKVRWRAALGDVHVSPLLLGSRLYVANTAGTCFCIERDDGLTRWSFDLPGNTTVKGIRSSPAGTGQSVCFGADDGFLYQLDAASGVLQWRLDTGSPIQATPVIHQDRVFVGTLGGRMVAVEQSSGTQLWSRDIGGSVYGPVLVDSMHVIVGTTAGQIVALQRSTGGIVWTTDVRAPVNSGILGAGEYAYAGTLRKDLIAFQRSTGSIVWREVLGGRVKTTPVAGAGRLFVAADNRILQAFRQERK